MNHERIAALHERQSDLFALIMSGRATVGDFREYERTGKELQDELCAEPEPLVTIDHRAIEDWLMGHSAREPLARTEE